MIRARVMWMAVAFVMVTAGGCTDSPTESVQDHALTKEGEPPVVDRDYDVPSIDMSNYVTVVDSVVQQFSSSLGAFTLETDPNMYSYCRWEMGGAFYICTFSGTNNWYGRCIWDPGSNTVGCSAWQP